MEKFVKKIVWLLGGVLFVFVAASTAATGGFHPECFYDGGEIDEIFPLTLQSEWAGLSYRNATDDFFTVTEDAAAEYLMVTGRKWKYAVTDISHLNTEKLILDISACDESWNIIKTQKIEIKGGKEIFELKLPRCKNLLIGINNQKGTQFRFDGLQLRRKLIQIDRKKMAFAGILAIFVYTGMTFVILILRKKKQIDPLLPFRRAERKCISCYLRAVRKTADVMYGIKVKLIRTNSKKAGSVMRTIALAAWILAEIYMRGYGLRTRAIPFHYLAAALVLFLFAITSLEERPKRQAWNHSLFRAWFWYSVLITISGIFVQKKWPGIGLLFLIVYAVWFWIWGGRKEPCRILADISYALKIVFWITTVISVFARTYLPKLPYSGIYNNQNVFVSFLIMLLAVDLSQAKDLHCKKEKNAALRLFLSLELCLILFFLLRTGSRGGMLTGMALMLLYLFRWGRKSRESGKKKLLFVLQTAILLFPVSYAAEHTILFVQSVFPDRIEYLAFEPEEDRILNDSYTGGKIVYAADGENEPGTALKPKSLDGFASGRFTLWKSYIRKLNLWGHFNKEQINGVATHSHNAFSYVAYLYGILALLPYTAMWCMIFFYGARYAKSAGAYRFLPLALTSGFFMQAMTDTLEEPFSVESWIIVYIVIGILFGLNSKKEEVQEKYGS